MIGFGSVGCRDVETGMEGVTVEWVLFHEVDCFVQGAWGSVCKGERNEEVTRRS